MNFKLFIISIVLISGFTGSAFAQELLEKKEFTVAEIDEMSSKAVLIEMHEGSFFIELFPQHAPNTVYQFLELAENGYYDGVVFHRIIQDFMIQTGDPNTKNPDKSVWGQGGPGYLLPEEFNTIQHDRGIVSMARGQHPNSAGSQFFIVHEDSNFLDGKYTAFGRLVPGTHSLRQLDNIASLETNNQDVPLNVFSATIEKATVLDSWTRPSFLEQPDSNPMLIKEVQTSSGKEQKYINSEHQITFHLPYRWMPVEADGMTSDRLDLILQPTIKEHNAQKQIDESGFTPQVLVFAEKRFPGLSENKVSPSFFSVASGEDPTVLNNYIITNSDGRQAHLMITTQNFETPTETVQFKILQLHFTNSELDYSIIYVNLAEWFRYESMSFFQTVKNFEIMIDGKMQPINFHTHPVFLNIMDESRVKPTPESLPQEDGIGGCLIATASYGSELAPQVQLLREIRDNTVLQTESGTSFMTAFNHFYYSFSPTIADYERENYVFKEAVKLTLTPLLASLTLLQYADIDSEHEMLGYGISLILLNIGIYFIAPAILITKIRSFYKLQ